MLQPPLIYFVTFYHHVFLRRQSGHAKGWHDIIARLEQLLQIDR